MDIKLARIKAPERLNDLFVAFRKPARGFTPVPEVIGKTTGVYQVTDPKGYHPVFGVDFEKDLGEFVGLGVFYKLISYSSSTNTFDIVLDHTVDHSFSRQAAIQFNSSNASFYFEGSAADNYITAKEGLNPLTAQPYQLVQYFLENHNKGLIGATIVPTEYFDAMVDYAEAAQKIKKHCDRVYDNIVVRKGDSFEIINIIEALRFFPIDVQRGFVEAISKTYNKNSMQAVVKRILLDKRVELYAQPLMTKEEQVTAFLSFSKSSADSVEEYVSDATIAKIKDSAPYQVSVEHLTSNGFGLSQTQQFNVVQSVGYFNAQATDTDIIYNLSDMGAGKTLMTVQSIFIMDLQAIEKLKSNEAYQYASGFDSIELPTKNLIAPKLSVESSWMKTFELFYTVEKKSDSQYLLSYEADGVTYTSMVNVASFTLKNALYVDNKLDFATEGAYLIIDEVHQLVTKPITSTKFFNDTRGPLDLHHYRTFILSGTLSNLTVSQWCNFAKLIQLGDTVLSQGSPSALLSNINAANEKLRAFVTKAATNIGDLHRTLDDDLGGPQRNAPSGKMTRQIQHANTTYNGLVLHVNEDSLEKSDLRNVLTRGDFNIRIDPLVDVPNFELFYRIVGASAITAESVQIAEELFGEQKKQHKAQVIKTASELDANDLDILRSLHRIISDSSVYKNKTIAIAISDAILNLNDGLGTNNIVDIINKYATTNLRFLNYLADLDVNLLERIKESNLIQEPNLTDTEKFSVLQNIIKNDKGTYLIVVNDYTAMVRLSKALGLRHLTQKQTRDQLNYQTVIDNLFDKQDVVVVPQHMIKSSLDIVKANRLVQYQLNTEIADIIQTNNRINRVGQTRETRAYYIATDQLQEQIIHLFLETYRNIQVAHKGIAQLFVDLEKQIDVVDDYLAKALSNVAKNSPKPDGESDSFAQGLARVERQEEQAI